MSDQDSDFEGSKKVNKLARKKKKSNTNSNTNKKKSRDEEDDVVITLDDEDDEEEEEIVPKARRRGLDRSDPEDRAFRRQLEQALKQSMQEVDAEAGQRITCTADKVDVDEGTELSAKASSSNSNSNSKRNSRSVRKKKVSAPPSSDSEDSASDGQSEQSDASWQQELPKASEKLPLKAKTTQRQRDKNASSAKENSSPIKSNVSKRKASPVKAVAKVFCRETERTSTPPQVATPRTHTPAPAPTSVASKWRPPRMERGAAGVSSPSVAGATGSSDRLVSPRLGLSRNAVGLKPLHPKVKLQ